MIKHHVAKAVKRLVYGGTEKYEFGGRQLKFLTGTRPIRRKYLNSKDDVVRNDVLQIEFFEKNFTPSDILWDIGSHHGHYSIFCASLVKNGRQIFSFEPDAAAWEKQIKNIGLNKFDSLITVMDIAVSNSDGEVAFKSMGGNANSHIVKSTDSMNVDTVVIKTKTINSLAAILPQPTFVKIDTEGAEIDILSEAGDLLSDANIRFICELHPFAWEDFEVSFEQFVGILERFNRRLALLDGAKSPADLPFYGTVLF